jgi:hypothetical protein
MIYTKEYIDFLLNLKEFNKSQYEHLITMENPKDFNAYFRAILHDIYCRKGSLKIPSGFCKSRYNSYYLTSKLNKIGLQVSGFQHAYQNKMYFLESYELHGAFKDMATSLVSFIINDEELPKYLQLRDL